MKENNLAFKLYKPEGKPQAAVVIVHGMEEHQVRYANFANYLKEHQIAVFTYDLPGHGQSCTTDELGYFGDRNGWNTLVESAHAAILKMKGMYPDIPVWYFGHSMGTIIGRCFLKDYDEIVDGMVLTGIPAYNPLAKYVLPAAKLVCKTKGKKGHSKVLDDLMVGAFNKVIDHPETPVDWLSYNKDNVQAYIDDPLCGQPFTVQGYVDLIEGMIAMGDDSTYNVSFPELPMLIMAGCDDPCIQGEKGFSTSVDFLRNVGYQNIEEKLYSGMRHEILNEDEHKIVYEDILSFIQSHYAK